MNGLESHTANGQASCPTLIALVAKLAEFPSFCLVLRYFFLLLPYLIAIDMLLSILLFRSSTYCAHPS